jgi:hypothetical protein
MTETSLLDRAEWRIFRLFVAGVEDDELDRIRRQLRREVATRQEWERDITRLFFSSLQTVDLTSAQEVLRKERRARAQDRRIPNKVAAP